MESRSAFLPWRLCLGGGCRDAPGSAIMPCSQRDAAHDHQRQPQDRHPRFLCGVDGPSPQGRLLHGREPVQPEPGDPDLAEAGGRGRHRLLDPQPPSPDAVSRRTGLPGIPLLLPVHDPRVSAGDRSQVSSRRDRRRDVPRACGAAGSEAGDLAIRPHRLHRDYAPGVPRGELPAAGRIAQGAYAQGGRQHRGHVPEDREAAEETGRDAGGGTPLRCRGFRAR